MVLGKVCGRVSAVRGETCVGICGVGMARSESVSSGIWGGDNDVGADNSADGE